VGTPEQIVDLGDAIVRNREIQRIRFDPGSVERRIEEVIARVEPAGVRHNWLVGPTTTPADLGHRLTARGFTLVRDWAGLVLEDITSMIRVSPDVTIEPLTEENAHEYAERCTWTLNDPIERAVLLAQAKAYISIEQPEVCILLARLEGRVAGFANLFIEPHGVAYLCDALTAADARNRGVIFPWWLIA
jgi:hypothetical protein